MIRNLSHVANFHSPLQATASLLSCAPQENSPKVHLHAYNICYLYKHLRGQLFRERLYWSVLQMTFSLTRWLRVGSRSILPNPRSAPPAVNDARTFFAYFFPVAFMLFHSQKDSSRQRRRVLFRTGLNQFAFEAKPAASPVFWPHLHSLQTFACVR